jgi:hypothetical protein
MGRGLLLGVQLMMVLGTRKIKIRGLPCTKTCNESTEKGTWDSPKQKKTKEKNTQKFKMEANQDVLLPGYIVFYTLEFRKLRQIT